MIISEQQCRRDHIHRILSVRHHNPLRRDNDKRVETQREKIKTATESRSKTSLSVAADDHLSKNQTRNRVARPKKMKNPPVSVIAVIITLEPSAGSRPSFIIVSGMSTPMMAAISRLSTIASVITAHIAISP